MMTSAILSALNVLTKPLEASAAGDAQSSQQEALVAALQTNRALLLERLQCEAGLEGVRKLREEVMAEAACWFSGDAEEDATWNFVQECLLLLLALARHLSVELALFNQNSAVPTARLRTPEMAPPLPPDVLSVMQQKALGAALQFVVLLGLSPYLAPGVGVPLGHKSAFGVMVGKVVLRCSGPERRLFTTTSVLLQLAELLSLATLVFTRHLGDVMAALCQLGYRPHRSDGGGSKNEMALSIEERKMCREALQSILGKVYQPIVIKELLILKGRPKKQPAVPAAGSSRAGSGAAPPWLRRLCDQLLNGRLMQPNGVQAVVRAILEGGPGGDPDWRHCDSVARILAAGPQQSVSSVSSDDYYRQVCPQILDLLHLKDKLTALQFQRVATRVLVIIVEDKPQFAQQYILTPLLGPLRRCATPTGDSQVTVGELELTRCVEDVYKVWVLGWNSASVPMLKALEEVLPVLFTLLCFTKQNVSHLRAPCQEILLWYLGHAEPSEALSALKQLSGLRGQREYGVPPPFHFTPGSEGGARLTPKETASDEDDVFYERLSEEQWRLDCLMQIFAELKDSDLPGDFLLELLQKLTSWTWEEDVEVDTSSMTLLEVEQHLSRRVAGSAEYMSLLQVLAVVCDVLPYTLLLRKTTQVVDFVVSLLQRACAGTESSVESQMLSMGMGLVATMLSAPQVSAEDYESMKRLLPPLEELSQKHPDVVIQELASGLRAVIATHGACKLEDLPQAARRSSSADAATMQNHSRVPSETELKKRQPQARDSQLSRSSPRSSTVQSRPSPHVNVTPARPASNGAHAQPTHASKPVRTQSGSVAGETQARDGTPTRIVPLDPGQSRHTETRGGLAPERGWTGAGERKADATSDPAASTGPFSDLLLEACDPDVTTRAVALRTLTRMVQEGDPAAVQAQEKVLMLYLENLEHEDSFVYLSAIQGLAVLSDSYPERILQKLLEDFQRGPSLPSSDKERSLETRLKVGEVLMRASRAMGALTPHLGRPLIGVFLQGTRDRDQTVRASCLSNLGEVCQRLDYALGPLAQELSCCLTALIKTEKEAEVRRAAVHVITMLLRGLSDKTMQVLSDVLLDLYRALKWVVRSDRDDVTVLHAQLALEELDDVMKKFIFPQQKLEKKIVVLP